MVRDVGSRLRVPVLVVQMWILVVQTLILVVYGGFWLILVVQRLILVDSAGVGRCPCFLGCRWMDFGGAEVDFGGAEVNVDGG